MKRIVIIGGGIVGLATAYRLLERSPDDQVTVLEKESNTGQHQSTHNSGVLHCGLYYQPGSLKARLAIKGIRQMTEFCQRFEIPHEICGKLVLATTNEETDRLRTLHQTGQKNGLRGLRWIENEAIREIEPHASIGPGHAGLHVPQEGIVDFRKVIDVLTHQVRAGGGEVVTGARVFKMRQRGSSWRIDSTAGYHKADFLVNCAGLHCDRVACVAGERPKEHIVPFRGEYFALRPERQHLVRNLIYPVPDPAFPFLGAHFTRLINGGIEAGPNAVLAAAREGYTKTSVNLKDLADALTFPGLWRFMNRHRRMCAQEAWQSLSLASFCHALQKLVPEVQAKDLAHGGAGVRAQAMTRDGSLVQDFAWLERKNALHLLNAPSPAATASLAIGDEIAFRALVQLER